MLQTPVMSVQLAFRIPQSVEDLAGVLRRFLALAKAREVRLVVFPGHTGLLLAPLLMAGMRPSLLRSAGRARQSGAPVFRKLTGWMASSMAGALRADMRTETEHWLNEPANLDGLQEAYRSLFAGLAAEFRLVVVAGTCLTPGPAPRSCRNTAHVFGPDGVLLGTQDELHPLQPLLGEPAAGEALRPIDTPAGRLGLLVGNDALFPETGRILAFAGTELFIAPVACPGHLPAAKLRHAFESRVVENEVFGIQSFLVGPNPWGGRAGLADFRGRSVIAGPMELVPRTNGILVETGESVEGVLPAQLDLPELHRWWESPFSLRRAMRTGIYGPALAPFYAAGQTVQDAVTAAQSVLPPALPEPGAQPLPAEPQSEPAEQSPEPEPFVEASLPDLPDPDERMKLWD